MKQDNVLEKAIDQLMDMVRNEPDDARKIIRFLLTRFDFEPAQVHVFNDEASRLIQHVGYDEEQCGRTK